MKPLPNPLDAGFSVVIPFYNEAENIRFVLEEVRRTLPSAEIIAVDDGSTDASWEEIKRLPDVRGIRLTRNMGQSAAMYLGLKACTRPVCGLMDGDGQNDPANFIPLLNEFYSGSAGVVCGYRANRSDTWDRKLASRIATDNQSPRWCSAIALMRGLSRTIETWCRAWRKSPVRRSSRAFGGSFFFRHWTACLAFDSKASQKKWN